jgi:DNA-binding MarR family transcriptional regulator
MIQDQDLRNQTISRIARVVGQLIWLGRKRFAQQFTPYGLTVPQYFTLFFLWHHGQPCPMNLLAELTYQDAATLTGIVDRLVKLGCVSRERGHADRRKVYVTLQEAGQRIVEEVREGRHENWRRSFAALSQSDLDEMLRMLETLMNAWQASEPTHPLLEEP